MLNLTFNSSGRRGALGNHHVHRQRREFPTDTHADRHGDVQLRRVDGRPSRLAQWQHRRRLRPDTDGDRGSAAVYVLSFHGDAAGGIEPGYDERVDWRRAHRPDWSGNFHGDSDGLIVAAADGERHVYDQYRQRCGREQQRRAEWPQYAKALDSGFDDSSGTMRVSAASFTADGKGNITNGITDTDNVSGAQASQAFTGTYTLGADNRGTITLSEVGVGGPPLTIAFAVGEIQGGIATKARFIRFDDVSGTGKRESGVLLRQDPTAFNLASVKGNYAFVESGSNTSNGTPESGVGFITADGNGNFTTGLIDLDSGGNIVPSAAISGPYTAPSASNGRFTSTLTIAGLPGTIAETFYVVSASQAIFISINSAGTTVTSGTAQLQVPPAGGFGLGSLSGNSVFSVQGLQAGASSNVHIGALSPDGNGNFTAAFDGNESGTSSSGTATGTYTVAANGRSVLTFTTVTGGGGGGIQPAIVYLDGVNQGFVGFTDGSASEGIIEPGGSGFTNATLSGNYFVGTLGPTENQVNDFSGVASFDGVGTTLQVTLDQSKPGGILQADQTLSTSYAVAANGRFTFTDESGETIVGYVASGCKAEVISSTGSNPGIIPFECQVTPVSGPVAQLSTAALTFGAQVTGATSAEQQVTVTNVGGSALNFTGFTATGDFACFAQGQSCALPNQQTANPPCSTATPLAPSASCDISVAFTPSATGTRNGTLSIADNATGSPQTALRLDGQGASTGSSRWRRRRSTSARW